MGITYVWVKVANPLKPRLSARIKMLVDSGAAYSMVPRTVLEKLGIKPRTKRSFLLADGTDVERRLSEARFEFQNESATSPVIFGEANDAALLGMVTLETLGLILDPFHRQLRPLPRLLAHQTLQANGELANSLAVVPLGI
jgi:clan AA aspartic protease